MCFIVKTNPNFTTLCVCQSHTFSSDLLKASFILKSFNIFKFENLALCHACLPALE